MEKLTIHYSVQNCGDGSAYPQFSLDKRIVDIHQELEEEWGEPCTGSISLESDTEIRLSGKTYLLTKESLLEDLEDRLTYTKDEDKREKYDKLIKELNEIE